MSDHVKIKVVIVDDEKPARDVIKVYLEKDTRFSLIGECNNGKEAVQTIVREQPDVVLLDIEMPELNGIDLLGKLGDVSPYIIFITAYREHAIEAFEENAVDYILKPFSEERFQKMLDRVAELVINTENVSIKNIQNAISLLQSKQQKAFLSKIPVKKKGKILFIPVQEIVWIESEGTYLSLHLRNKKSELIHFSMKEMEMELNPSQYIRIHKSYMINLEEIESMESYFHGEYIITMNDGAELKLSRGYKENLHQILNQYKA